MYLLLGAVQIRLLVHVVFTAAKSRDINNKHLLADPNTCLLLVSSLHPLSRVALALAVAQGLGYRLR